MSIFFKSPLTAHFCIPLLFLFLIFVNYQTFSFVNGQYDDSDDEGIIKEDSLDNYKAEEFLGCTLPKENEIGCEMFAHIGDNGIKDEEKMEEWEPGYRNETERTESGFNGKKIYYAKDETCGVFWNHRKPFRYKCRIFECAYDDELRSDDITPWIKFKISIRVLKNDNEYGKPELDFAKSKTINGIPGSKHKNKCLKDFHNINFGPICGDPNFAYAKHCTMVDFFDNQLPEKSNVLIGDKQDMLLVLIDGCAVCEKKDKMAKQLALKLSVSHVWPAGSIFTGCKEKENQDGFVF